LGVKGPNTKMEERFVEGHGELMAKKWLDSIEKQKKEEAIFVTNRHTDR